MTSRCLAALAAALLWGTAAVAWSPAGHETVGAIADALLTGTRAGAQVAAILGAGESLQAASLWADCAKGVERDPTTGVFHYREDPRYRECVPFQSAAGRRAMVAFVRRNWDTCHPQAGAEACHRQYHYADVAIERDSYARTDVGTSDHDIVSAIQAAVTVLRGGKSPAPVAIANRKEALRLLAHLLGDVHQPLHVGAVYLDAHGQVVDPDSGAFDPATQNQGGNRLMDGTRNLHAEWDGIPSSLTVPAFREAGVAAAKLVPVSAGPVGDWPLAWASETVSVSHRAFEGLTFGAESGGRWPVMEPAGYADAREALQKAQLVKAGARLAQLLEAIWP